MTLIGSSVNIKSKHISNETEKVFESILLCRYQQQNAFDALSEEEKKTLQNEFDEFRHGAYQAALEGEVSIQFRTMKGIILLFSLVKKIEL